MTFDDTNQTAAQGSALSLYSLTFLRWYISYDSPLKRGLKDTFLLPLLTCVFPSLTISFVSPFGLGRFGFAAFAVSVPLFQNNIDFIRSRHMFHLDTKDFHRIVFCVQTTRKSSQVERNFAMKFEQAQISRKPSSLVTTSHHKLAVKRGRSMHMLMTWVRVWSGL